VPTTPPPSPNKPPIPKSNFRVRTGTPFLNKPNPSSDVSLLSTRSIVPPLRRLYTTLGLPLFPPPAPICHPTPTLRQNWSPREKWHSALTGIRAANRFSYFAAAAAASRTSTQSSGGWDDVIDQNPSVTQVLEDQDPSSGIVAQVPSKEGAEKEEEEDTGQDDIMPGSF